MDKKINLAFYKWKERMEDNKIEAICKPCWDLKYCPYGPLVEQFPITNDLKYKCKVFGHQCPVFTTAEPFSETKTLRNISRSIPQVIKFKVLRRDNNICQLCGHSVLDENINFDHIVPWSKGGSSDEGNIRILCSECNKKRSNNFENELLIAHISELNYDSVPLELDMLIDLLNLYYIKQQLSNKVESSDDDFLNIIQSDDKETDIFMNMLVNSIDNNLNGEIPLFPIKKKSSILKYRWGNKINKPHSVKDTIKRFNIDINYYLEIENYLLRQLGFTLRITDKEKLMYMESFTDLGFVDSSIKNINL